MNKPEYLRIFLVLFIIYSLVGVLAVDVKADDVEGFDISSSMWVPGEAGFSDDYDFEYVTYSENLTHGEDIVIRFKVDWSVEWNLKTLNYFVVLKLLNWEMQTWDEVDTKSLAYWRSEAETTLNGGEMGYYNYYFQIEVNKGFYGSFLQGGDLLDYETMEVYGGVIEGEKGIGEGRPLNWHSSTKDDGGFFQNLLTILNPVEYHNLITSGMPGWLYAITTVILTAWVLVMMGIIAEFIRSNIPTMG